MRVGELTVRLEDLALALGHAVDPAVCDLVPGRKETLPACDRVGADDGAVLVSNYPFSSSFPWEMQGR